MDVSVVVSTYNRPEHVRRLLESLDTIEVRAGITWEAVVADNNSSDETADVIRAFARQAKFPLHYVFEARQGKSYGVNTGLSIATGRILAFTDHDVVVPPDWIQQIVDFFEANAAAACVGGMVRLHDARDAPQAVRLSPHPKIIGMEDFPLKYIPILGCNMAIRADLLRKIGDFDTDLCPGSRIGAADDMDMLYRILRTGQHLYYAPSIRVGHNHGRRTPEELGSVQRGYVAGRGAFYCKHILGGDLTAAYRAFREFGALLLRALGAGAREALLDMAWLTLGALRYVRFHRRVKGTRFRKMDGETGSGPDRHRPSEATRRLQP